MQCGSAWKGKREPALGVNERWVDELMTYDLRSSIVNDGSVITSMCKRFDMNRDIMLRHWEMCRFVHLTLCRITFWSRNLETGEIPVSLTYSIPYPIQTSSQIKWVSNKLYFDFPGFRPLGAISISTSSNTYIQIMRQKANVQSSFISLNTSKFRKWVFLLLTTIVVVILLVLVQVVSSTTCSSSFSLLSKLMITYVKLSRVL